MALEDETHDRWRAVAQYHGVTLSALLEAIGRLIEPEPREEWPLLRQAVIDARRIQAERNDRRSGTGAAESF